MLSGDEPKEIVNMNRLQSYDVKKDMSFILVEGKKGLFSSTRKTTLKAATLDDLEQWVHIFDRILKH